MEYWSYFCGCLIADFVASAVLGILAARFFFFSARYRLDGKARKEITIFLIAFSTLARIIIYVLLLVLYEVFLTITGLSG
jgi:hypothetical protein